MLQMGDSSFVDLFSLVGGVGASRNLLGLSGLAKHFKIDPLTISSSK